MAGAMLSGIAKKRHKVYEKLEALIDIQEMR